MIAMLFALAWVSAFGLLAAVALLVTKVAGVDYFFAPLLSKYVTMGVFVVWVPFVIMAQKATENTVRRDFWTKIMEGGPPWFADAVTWSVVSGVGLMVVSFFFSPASASGRRINTAIGPAVSAGFYAVALMGYYSRLARERLQASRASEPPAPGA